MSNFSRRILVHQGFCPEFSFNRIYTTRGIGFHVSVVDQHKQSRFFTMEQTSEGWRIVNAPKLPDWIMNIEKKLSESITENTEG